MSSSLSNGNHYRWIALHLHQKFTISRAIPHIIIDLIAGGMGVQETADASPMARLFEALDSLGVSIENPQPEKDFTIEGRVVNYRVSRWNKKILEKNMKKLVDFDSILQALVEAEETERWLSRDLQTDAIGNPIYGRGKSETSIDRIFHRFVEMAYGNHVLAFENVVADETTFDAISIFSVCWILGIGMSYSDSLGELSFKIRKWAMQFLSRAPPLNFLENRLTTEQLEHELRVQEPVLSELVNLRRTSTWLCLDNLNPVTDVRACAYLGAIFGINAIYAESALLEFYKLKADGIWHSYHVSKLATEVTRGGNVKKDVCSRESFSRYWWWYTPLSEKFAEIKSKYSEYLDVKVCYANWLKRCYSVGVYQTFLLPEEGLRLMGNSFASGVAVENKFAGGNLFSVETAIENGVAAMELSRTNSVRLGKHPWCANTESVMSLEDLSQTDEPVVTIGTERDFQSSKLTAWLISDLSQYFNECQSFLISVAAEDSDSVNKIYLSERVIQKLKRFCVREGGRGISPATAFSEEKWQSLSLAIEKVERRRDNFLELSRKFSKNENAEERFILINLLKRVLMAAWKMRGLGVSCEWPELPMKSEQCCGGGEKSESDPVENTLAELNIYLAELTELKSKNLCVAEKWLKLPLLDRVSQIAKEIQYFPVYNPSQAGFTIHDRIMIILQNESVHACIRTSSNVLITSCYYFLKILDCEEGFDLEGVAEIF